MPDDDDDLIPESGYLVLPAGEMRKRFGLYAENRPVIKLDPAKVPEALRPIIPYAELWGVADDLIREDMVDKAPPEALGELARIVEENDDELDKWLAGPEADRRPLTAEYIAFSCMRLEGL